MFWFLQCTWKQKCQGSLRYVVEKCQWLECIKCVGIYSETIVQTAVTLFPIRLLGNHNEPMTQHKINQWANFTFRIDEPEKKCVTYHRCRLLFYTRDFKVMLGVNIHSIYIQAVYINTAYMSLHQFERYKFLTDMCIFPAQSKDRPKSSWKRRLQNLSARLGQHWAQSPALRLM